MMKIIMTLLLLRRRRRRRKDFAWILIFDDGRLMFLLFSPLLRPKSTRPNESQVHSVATYLLENHTDRFSSAEDFSPEARVSCSIRMEATTWYHRLLLHG
jgi:hypothetical protein